MKMTRKFVGRFFHTVNLKKWELGVQKRSYNSKSLFR